jgi:catechol-2,3-dioxygenase
MAIAQSLDHFVVPVDDLVVAEDFYARVFDGALGKRNGLNVRQRKRGAVPHTFIQIGGKRMGVYLQSDERPKPDKPRGLPTYSFTTTEAGLKELAIELKQFDINYAGPIENSHPFAKQTLFLTDPAGNHYAVYVPRDSGTLAPPTLGRMTGVGYIELEAPGVEASITFYHDVLGFEMQSRSPDGKQATLKMASGQTLILTEAPFASKGLVMSRKVPGPHIAFYIPTAKWSEAIEHLAKLGIANGDRGAAKEPSADRGGTYMDDPAGYVIQFITDGLE